MTYPPTSAHIPTAGQAKAARDHAKGTQQLRVSLLAVWLDKYALAHQHDHSLMSLYHSTAPWLTRCMVECGAGRKQRQSAVVMRRADVEIRMVERIRIDEIGNPETADQWAAWLITLAGIAQDCATAWEGGKGQCWDSLWTNFDLMARRFLAMTTDQDTAEVRGTRMYERAMESVVWI